MKYGIVLTILGAAQITLARTLPGISFLLWWSGLAWIAAGLFYLANQPLWFGKQADGRLVLWKVVLLLPFFIAAWLLWHLQILVIRESDCAEVASGLWIGRRCYNRELPPGMAVIVDLTCEFPETRAVVEGRTYLCLPILDASVPQLQDFHALIDSIASASGPVYIHCALGHGRSAMVMAAVLVKRGETDTIESAVQMIRSVRPGIAINSEQQRLLQAWISA